jgi:Uma2 family endonuclease
MSRVALTYKDYAALPDDGRRYQILDGELCVTPAPNRLHQKVSANLCAALHAHVRQHALGEVYAAPTDVILADTTIVQPDVLFIANDRFGVRSDRGIEGAPTLAVEILSPSTAETDRHRKLRLYARFGIPWYWIVDPDARVVEVYRLEGARYALASRHAGGDTFAAEPFAGLTLTPDALWG